MTDNCDKKILLSTLLTTRWTLLIMAIGLPVLIHTAPTGREDHRLGLFKSSASAALGGCFYDGRHYLVGEAVTTEEACLKCSCKSTTLVCYLRVCPELPYPPPRGCHVLQRKGVCCPRIICDDDSNFIRLERKEGENAILLQQMSKNISEVNGCIAGGTVYAEGSAMMSSGLCEHCFCIRGEQKCVKPKCTLPLPGCKPRYRDFSCCPSDYDCSEAMKNVTTIRTTTSTTTIAPQTTTFTGCTLGSRYYREGSQVSDKGLGIGGSCDTCFCMGGKVRCTPHACDPPLDGCIPLLHPGHCCPKEYICNNSLIEAPYSGGRLRSLNPIKAQSLEPQQTTQEPFTTSSVNDDSNYDEEIIPRRRNNRGKNRWPDHLQYLRNRYGETRSKQSNNITVWETTDATSPDDNSINKEIFPTTNIITTSKTDDGTTTPYFDDVIQTTTWLPVSTLPQNAPAPQDIVLGDKNNNLTLKMSTNNDENEDDPEVMSLPPSLPNLRIIPFVAADAVDQDLEEGSLPTISNQKMSPSAASSVLLNWEKNNPVLMGIFSPPKETEGGFIPHLPGTENQEDESDAEIRNQQVVNNTTPVPSSTTMKPEIINTTKKSADDESPSNNSTSKHKTSVSAVLGNAELGILPGLNHRPTMEPIVNTPDPFKDVIKFQTAPNLATMTTKLPHVPSVSKIIVSKTSSTTPLSTTKETKPSVTSTTTRPNFEDFESEESTSDESKVDDESTSSIFHPLFELLRPLLTGNQNTEIQTTTMRISTTRSTTTKSTTTKPLFSVKPYQSPKPHNNIRPTIPQQLTDFLSPGLNSLTPDNHREVGHPTFLAGLKLSGCNIYGRMYRLGRIIPELSGPCSECKCTERGVQCIRIRC